MTSVDHGSYPYYSYSKHMLFQRVEKLFRYAQSTLLLYMIFCFIFYMITFGIDIAKLSNNLAYLLISLGIDILAMGFIALGVRGVALEIWPYIICFLFVIVLVTVGHGVTFMFRIRSLNCANFVFDLVLSLIAIYYAAMLYRFEKLKPADYNVRHEQVNGDDEFTGGLNMSIPDTRTGTECLFKSPTESKLTEITGTDISDGLTDGSKH